MNMLWHCRQVWWCEIVNDPMFPVLVDDRFLRCPLCQWLAVREDVETRGWIKHRYRATIGFTVVEAEYFCP